MMPRALRFLALTALFAVTGLAAMLVLFSVETAIGELPYWGLHQLGRRLIWFWLILAHAPLRGLVSPLAWISVSGALYLLGREPLQTSAVWRTVRAALGLSLGLCALVPTSRWRRLCLGPRARSSGRCSRLPSTCTASWLPGCSAAWSAARR